MNILIIGSKGFIGSHALSYYKNKGYNTYGADVAVDYTDKKYFLIGSDSPNFNEPFEKIRFDFCINCAGAASVPDSIKNPLRDYTLNAHLVFLILAAIKKNHPQCKFLNLGTAAVYGNPQSLPIKENHQIAPLSPYGLHKKQAEEICKEFYEHFDILTCTARIFSAYGPGLKKQLFWDLHTKSSVPKMELFGTGNESRDFIFIDDLMLALDLILHHSSFNGNTINVANGEEIFIKDAVSYFNTAYNYTGELNFIGKNRKGDPINWRADISFLNQHGYQPQYTLKQGLQKYCKWLRTLK